MTSETCLRNETSKQNLSYDYRLRYRNTWRLRVGWAWTRYLLAGRHWDVPDLVDFIFINHFFAPMQRPAELMALGRIVADLQPRQALEIGTGQGGTLLFLARLASPTATMVSVDLEEGEAGGYNAGRQWFYERFARRRQNLRLLRGDTHQFWMPRRVRESLEGLLLDYLFIDGDHRYEGVKKDFETYGGMVRRGGVIAIHDIVEGPPEQVGGVPKLWNEIKGEYRCEELIEDPDQEGHGIGVVYLD